MTKKRKVILSVMVCVIVLSILTGVLLFIKYKPYIRGAMLAKSLVKEDYSFDMECYIKGVTFKEGEYGQYRIKADGEKSDEVIHGYVYSDEMEYLEVWGDSNGNVMFNLRYMCEFISKYIEEAIGVDALGIDISMDDTYLSLEEVEEIIDKDIISINDFGMDDYSLFKEGDGTDRYEIEMIAAPKDMNVDYDKDSSYFFRLTLLDYGTKVIIGIPKAQEDTFLYVNMEREDMQLEIRFSYDFTEDVSVYLPESTFSEEYIEAFKRVYRLWMITKSVYE